MTDHIIAVITLISCVLAKMLFVPSGLPYRLQPLHEESEEENEDSKMTE